MSAAPLTTSAPATQQVLSADPAEGEAPQAPTAPTQAQEVPAKTESAPAVLEDKPDDPVKVESAPVPVGEKKGNTPVAATAPASAPAAAEEVHEEAEKKPATPAPTALAQLFTELPAILKDAEHKEMWEVPLTDASNVPTTIVLEKFLRANNKDVSKAKAQLIEALRWRKKMQPRKLLDETAFDAAKYGGLGFVTVYEKNDALSREKEIVTWNIYGSVKDNKATFGNVEEFVKWRAALMELSLRELNLPAATEPIPADGVDQYRMVQVHDYQGVSFLRMDPNVKAASKETIQTFSMAYPELLKEKFFVNVPLLMGWVFAAMKVFLSAATVKKFHPLAYGSALAGECKGWGEDLPAAYGGKGKDVKDGLSVKYASTPAEEATSMNE